MDQGSCHRNANAGIGLSFLVEHQLDERVNCFLDVPTTEDLDAEFPAAAAREMGWIDTPLLCTREIAVPKSLIKCIRILMTVNSSKSQKEIQHVYLREAVNLRR